MISVPELLIYLVFVKKIRLVNDLKQNFVSAEPAPFKSFNDWALHMYP